MVSRVYGSTEVPVTTVGALGDLEHAAETDGQRRHRRHQAGRRPRSVPADPRCWSATYIPRTRPRSFDDEGFFRTGDLGRWVDDEYLVVTGRAKDIIIRNGENISPKEIEDILVGHPDIAEIAVVGVPDARTGERACAVIVPPTASPGPDVEACASCPDARHGVAKFKVPEQVVIWDALPKNDAGKVLKHQIRATLTKVDDVTCR